MLSNRETIEAYKLSAAIWIAIFTVLFAAYSTSVALPFAYHDDYYYFAYDISKSFKFHPQYWFFLLVGREGYVLIAALMVKMIHGVGDLSHVRLLFIVILAMGGVMITRFLAQCGVSVLRATLLSILILLLSGFQVGALWVTMAPFVIAMLMSFEGGRLAVMAGQKFAEAHELSWRALLDLKYPMALGMLATFIYQPWAMFYLLPACGYLIFSPLGSIRRTLIILASVGVSFFLSVVSYFLLHRYLFLPFIFHRHPELKASYEANAMFAFKITTNVWEKIHFFFHEVLLHATNLWNIYLSGKLEFAVLLVIFLGVVARFVRMKIETVQRTQLLDATCRILALAMLSVGSVLPVIVASGGHSGFRVVAPMSAMLILMAGAATIEMCRLIGRKTKHADLASLIIFGGVCALASTLAWGNVRDSAFNASQEYLSVKALMSNYLHDSPNKGKVIHFTLANPNYSTTGHKPAVGVGEFNFNSTAFWQDVPWVMRAALLDLGESQDQACIWPIAQGKKDMPEDCTVLVIEPYGSKN